MQQESNLFSSLRNSKLVHPCISGLDELDTAAWQQKTSGKRRHFPVRTEDSMEYLVSKLKSEWQHEINSCLPSDCKPRLWRAFTRMFSWKAYTLMFVLVLCRFLCTILLPTLMWFFLSEFVRESQGDASTSSYVFVTGIIILALFKGFSKNHSASMAEIWSNRLKVSCIGLIYEKVIVFPLYRFKKGYLP